MGKNLHSSDSVSKVLDKPEKSCARYLQLSGKVQGVGLRPFVKRLSVEYKLTGWVRNTAGIVEILLQGKKANIDEFIVHLTEQPPSLAEPVLQLNESVEPQFYNGFSILAGQSVVASISDNKLRKNFTILPDQAICEDCLADMNDPGNRRYRYPFINCTQCGPRYTLIRQLPYDRENTTMSGFPLCRECLDEYQDINNRRFHAEPIACCICGPQLSFHSIDRNNTLKHSTVSKIVGNDNSITACINALKQGQIIALKGIGGYHLMCDATNENAIRKLRERKHRQSKPLALMFSADDNNYSTIEKLFELDEQAKEFLLNTSRPILLVRKGKDNDLPEQIAPGLNETGIMLAYSPLHYLILNDFTGPLVATSANMTGEPVLIDNDEVESRLKEVVDGFLHHNRPIEHVADDSVYRRISGKPRPLRMGRGISPLEIELPFELPHPVLAVGAQMKNTFTLGWGRRAVVSPHMGDMQSPRSLALFEKTLSDYLKLYAVDINSIICDAHPGYTLTRWAQQQDAHSHTVFHHHAHAAAAWYECNTQENIVCFCWDGLGYGEDKTLWGGEAFIGKPANWKRVASIRPFNISGGDTVAHQPWRSAAALCWEAGLEYLDIPETDPLIRRAWQKKINTQQTSSVGRLFDAAAALTGVSQYCSYDAEAPMRLEALCDSLDDYISCPMYMDGNVMRADWQPLIPAMQDKNRTQQQRSELFHATMVELLVQQAVAIRQQYQINQLAFSGGVFQNRVLTEAAISRLKNEGFEISLAEKIPLNDAGISAGQLMEYAFSSGAG